MNKKIVSRVLVGVAILLVVLPFVLDYFFRINPVYILRPLGIRYFLDQYWFYAAGVPLLVSSLLQFPCTEEEAWHCKCGYDLSYLHKKTSKCPECGKDTLLEWTPIQGEYSLKTKKRLYWAILLFFAGLGLFGVGLLTKFINEIAKA